MLEEKKNILRMLLKGLRIMKDKTITENILESIDRIIQLDIDCTLIDKIEEFEAIRIIEEV